MTTKDEILEILSREKPYLTQKYGVEKIGLFGSYSRNEATNESDIDIYVELKENTFRKLAGLWNYLDDLYGEIKVDMVNKHRHAKSEIFKCIQKETIYI
jgi:predicted nucleotidyltransferase